MRRGFAAIVALAVVSVAGVCFAQEKPNRTSPKEPRLTRPQGSKPSSAATGAVPPISPTESPPEEIVRVETDLVTTLFTAMDRNHRFVTTLRQEDVRILENGAPQEVQVFQRETGLPLSLAILVDVSKSMERTLPDEKAAAAAFIVSVLRPGTDRAAAISFNGKPAVDGDLTGNPTGLLHAIARMRVEVPPDNPDCEGIFTTVDEDPRCWTSIWDAVWASTNEILAHTPERTRRAIILITDGYDTSSMMKRQEAVDIAAKNNVVVYGIGFTDPEHYKVDEGALRKIAERTGGRAFFPHNEEELRGAFKQIQEELRSQYLIAYSPKDRTRDGSFRQIRIEIVNPELRKQKLRLLYRQGYYAKRSPQRHGDRTENH
jgi:VWFA-related protein